MRVEVSERARRVGIRTGGVTARVPRSWRGIAQLNRVAIIKMHDAVEDRAC